MNLIDIRAGQNLTSTDYDQLTCCNQPMQSRPATDGLPVRGAVCETCLCVITSRPAHGPAIVNRCQQHR